MDKATLFSLFYAIFWGGILNVAHRWKMFQMVLSDVRVRLRFEVAFLLMVLFPVGYFGWMLRVMGGARVDDVIDVFGAVLPALFIFVLYRTWMVVIEAWPDSFYWGESEVFADNRLRLIDTTIEELGLNHGYGPWWNVLAVAIYFVVALVVPGYAFHSMGF